MRGRETERDIQKERETHVLVHSPGTQSSEIRAKSREGKAGCWSRRATGGQQGAGREPAGSQSQDAVASDKSTPGDPEVGYTNLNC